MSLCLQYSYKVYSVASVGHNGFAGVKRNEQPIPITETSFFFCLFTV